MFLIFVRFYRWDFFIRFFFTRIRNTIAYFHHYSAHILNVAKNILNIHILVAILWSFFKGGAGRGFIEGTMLESSCYLR